MSAGASVKKTLLTGEFGIDEFRNQHGQDSVPLMLLGPKGEVRVFSIDQPPTPAAGWTLLSLVAGESETIG